MIMYLIVEVDGLEEDADQEGVADKIKEVLVKELPFFIINVDISE
jgi:hypothetical protein